jgi:SynChlorMet cassette protein ScmD
MAALVAAPSRLALWVSMLRTGRGRRYEAVSFWEASGAAREGETHMGQSDRPIANPVVVLREEFDDWAVLFNPDTAEAVGINPVGVAIWKLLDGEHAIPDIAGQIDEGFADVPKSAPQEVQAFVDDLARRGFVGYEVTNEGA